MYQKLNVLLKETIGSILEKYSNYSGIRTKIARILIGANSQPSILKWLDDKTNTLNFGISPLSKIAQSAKYKVLITIVPDEDTEITQLCQNKNIEFATKLKQLIIEYLEDSTPSSKAQIDKLVSKYDEIFAEIK